MMNHLGLVYSLRKKLVRTESEVEFRQKSFSRMITSSNTTFKDSLFFWSPIIDYFELVNVIQRMEKFTSTRAHNTFPFRKMGFQKKISLSSLVPTHTHTQTHTSSSIHKSE